MKCILFATLLIFIMPCSAQEKTVTYIESTADIVNPERGFYIPTETRASRFIPLLDSVLNAYRSVLQQRGKASYGVKVSLIYRGYELDIYTHQPLPDTLLNKLQQDFDAVRKAGLKMILRFAYTNTAKTGNCRDEYKICPPYGDASVNIVLQHIAQLKPLLRKNADVIAVVQEGFIGIWGENYFTDYFGDASTNASGIIADSSWLHRNSVLAALLDALPTSRMVQVRTPQIKQKFVYGPSAGVSSLPMTAAQAFNNAAIARIGFHNDCFLSSADDYGTYYDYGSSSQPRRAANEILRKYISADTKFTVVGGETCDDAFSPQNDCAPGGYAEQEMATMHYSYLNAGYNTAVVNDWDSGGCLPSIKKKLGYRLVLHSTTFQTSGSPGKAIRIKMVIENAGYATIYNPRPVQLVLRNSNTGKAYAITLQADPRFWFTGSHTINESVLLPRLIPKGQYQLLINLPDGSNTLAGRPEYAIQLANDDVWEPNTGYNNLRQTLSIK